MTTMELVSTRTLAVQVVIVEDYFDPKPVEVAVEWRVGMTMADLAPQWEFMACALDMRVVDQSQLAEELVLPSSRIVFVQVPGNKYIPGAVILIIGLVSLSPHLTALGIAQLALAALTPDLPGRTVSKAEESNVYSWNGPFTTYSPKGTPLQLAYGEHLQGGNAVLLYNEIVDGDPPQSYLTILLVLGSGPIESIGGYTTDQDGLTGENLPVGMQINGNSVENFDEVEVWLRMGTQNQSVIPGLSFIPTNYSVDQVVDQVHDTPGTIDVPVVDWSMAVVFDMPAGEVADESLLTFLFPSGLFKTSGSGKVNKADVFLQVRYIELDGGGNPTGAYTDVTATGDFKITAKVLSAFSKQLKFTHYNAATYTTPMPVDCLRFNSSSNDEGQLGLSDGSSGGNPWVLDADIGSFTFIHWIRPKGNGPGNKPHQPVFAIAEWDGVTGGNDSFPIDATAQVKGLMVTLEMADANFWEVRVFIGEGVGNPQARIFAGNIEVDEPVMIAVTYEPNAVFGENRLRLYLDGVLAGELITAVSLKVPNENVLLNVLPGKQGTGTPLNKFHGNMDHAELRMHSSELTASRLLTIFASGLPSSLSGATLPNDLTFGCTLETKSTFGNQAVPSALQTTFRGWLLMAEPHTNGASHCAPANDPILLAFATGNEPRRARWRIEVQRIDLVQEDATHHDVVSWQTLTAIVNEPLAYPLSALCAIKMLATDQLSGNFPSIGNVVRGRKDIPHWDGLGDHVDPGLTTAYTKNPFWILAHAHMDADSGAGHLFKARHIDWPALKEAADYADEKVYDMRGRFGGANTSWNITLHWVANTLYEFGEFELQCQKPTPAHIIPDETYIRISNVANPWPANDPGYPEGDLLVIGVRDINSTTYGVVCVSPSPTAPINQTDGTTEFQGIEARLECNLVLSDRGLPFLDGRQIIAQTGRASIATLGDKLKVHVSRPRQPVAAFNPSNIELNSFQLTSSSKALRYNSAVSDIQNKDRNWDRDAVPFDHETLATSLDPTRAVRRIESDLRGVTNASQAIREMALMLNVYQLITKAVKFSTGLDGLFLDIGDVFSLAHPMPLWDHGGRVDKDSTVQALMFVDHDFILGQLNMLEQSRLFSATQWVYTGAGPASVINDGELDDDSQPYASELFFPTGAGNMVRQSIPAREPTTEYTFIIWLRLESGGNNDVSVQLASASGVLDSLTPTLTGAWTRYVVSDTTALPFGSDPEIYAQLVGNGTSALIHAAWPRLIIGPDDGLDASGLSGEATDDIADHFFCVINPDGDNSLHVAQSEIVAGSVSAEDTIRLKANIGFLPKQGMLWTMGPATYAGRLFEVSSISFTDDFKTAIQASEYNEAVYPDPEDFANITKTIGNPTDLGQLSAATLSDDALPGLPTSVGSVEESFRDSVSGNLQKSILVSWQPESATADRVDRVRIWIEDVTALAAHERQTFHVRTPDLVGEVSGSERTHRILGELLEPGVTYRIYIQFITRSGLRRQTMRCPSTKVRFLGLFERPGAVVSPRWNMHGGEASYDADYPSDFQASETEIFRGGTFVGQEVGRIPVHSSHFGPTSDWCILTAAADGRASPPVNFRLVTDQGSRGRLSSVAEAVRIPVGYTDLLDDSMEDGPWDVAGVGYSEVPVLSNFAKETPLTPAGAPDRLAFTGSGLTGEYTSTIYDLVRPRLAHISFGIFGVQVPPTTMAEVSALGSLRARSWTPEGYLDPTHPSYGRLAVRLLWRYSTTAGTPTSAWGPFRCGHYYFRSCQFRIEVVRPDATWDVWITRAGVVIRDPPHSTDIDGGGLA